MDIVSAFRRALAETGIATVFTAITLSVGVATWVFSPLKFQADMGLLLAFMFMLNMLMAITRAAGAGGDARHADPAARPGAPAVHGALRIRR